MSSGELLCFLQTVPGCGLNHGELESLVQLLMDNRIKASLAQCLNIKMLHRFTEQAVSHLVALSADDIEGIGGVPVAWATLLKKAVKCASRSRSRQDSSVLHVLRVQPSVRCKA